MLHNALASFVETQNIARFRALLETETHPDKRNILLRLLQQEEVKRAARIKVREQD